MKKPHLTPISSNFHRPQNNTIEYTDKDHFIQFDCNSISFKPLTVWEEAAPENIDLIFQNFQAILRKYNEKHFHKLSLNFYEWEGLDTPVLRRLGCEIGKHFRNLHGLSLHFFCCNSITETGIQHLISPISRHLTGLRTLSLSVTGRTSVSEKGASYIKTLLLKRVKNLSKLSLIFEESSSDNSEEGYPFEANVLTRLKRSLLINLSTRYCQLKDTPIAAFKIWKSMRYFLPTLQQLILVRSNGFRNIQIFPLVFQRARRLQVLYLDFFDDCLDGHHKIKKINIYTRKNLSKLRYLTVCVDYLNQTRKKNLMAMLSNTFPHLPELSGFTLSVDNAEKISDEDLLLIINQICLHGKHLESLILYFKCTKKITGSALEKATQALSQHLVDLKELTLSFPCTGKTWSSHAATLLSFSSLVRLHLFLPENNCSINLSGCAQHLEELTLSFSECKERSGGEFENLVAPIFNSELQGVRQLNLLVEQADERGDEDIMRLCSYNWILLPNLKELTLHISSTETITDCALSHIAKLIKAQLKSLSTLKLLFRLFFSDDSFIPLLTENGISELSETIVKNMKELNDLELDFPDIYISQEVVDLMVTKIARHAKKLKKIRLGFSSSVREDYNFNYEMRKKLSFVPVVDFSYCMY